MLDDFASDHSGLRLVFQVGGCTGAWIQKLKGTMCVRQGCVITNLFCVGTMRRKRKKKKRKVYAGQRPRALRKGSLTSKLARASPEVPQNYTSYS
eukprot:1072257-Pelagomonas_calceolata.AAC.3